ncbi:MAG: PRD domain-containing protein [Eubacterium sp.]|nr:PRD domain-containing protein [Eubacterium sp.]
MVARQILNNNLVLTKNSAGEEIIVKGKGIGFQKSKGDTIDESRIEKIFTFEKTRQGRRFQSFLSSMQAEFIDLADKIVDYALMKYDMKLSDSIYIALSDHLEGVYSRYENGMQLPNGLLFDIQRMYRQEYDVGKYALELLKQEKGMQLRNDEAGYIAMHLINAQTDHGMEDIYMITKVVGEVLDLVQMYFGMVFNDEDYNFQRLQTHLKFFAQRLLMGNQYYEQDDGLFEVIRERYPDVYACVLKIVAHIENQYCYNMSKEEMLYLMIHIERVRGK